jgi:osmotically-inducible protein OsmY
MRTQILFLNAVDVERDKMQMGDHMSTDKFLRKKILNYFKLHTEIDSARVKVEVHDSNVILLGRVDGPVARATLEGLARSLKEVQNVINQLEIDSDNMTGVEGIHL